ncbi:hypothetical protein JGU71_23750 [Antrihabitans sp. YC3-6]|uniref:Uncharacterized protein n=1 Tax=Antrihabitans stalagmiti TaxID=2799499 RepID=A0A934NV83_9NOCA|nr:hypothetical protein [Antrihabitans stalagmiti]MBJ8341905.1 hypothetical protein [Antrihabitans stalagmiti]
MVTKILRQPFRVSQLIGMAILFAIPYLAMGFVWLYTHNDHLEPLVGANKFFSALGGIVAWPVLIFSNLTLQ